MDGSYFVCATARYKTILILTYHEPYQYILSTYPINALPSPILIPLSHLYFPLGITCTPPPPSPLHSNPLSRLYPPPPHTHTHTHLYSSPPPSRHHLYRLQLRPYITQFRPPASLRIFYHRCKGYRFDPCLRNLIAKWKDGDERADCRYVITSLITSPQHTLLSHPINTPYQHSLSIHPLTHPIIPPILSIQVCQEPEPGQPQQHPPSTRRVKCAM